VRRAAHLRRCGAARGQWDAECDWTRLSSELHGSRRTCDARADRALRDCARAHRRAFHRALVIDLDAYSELTLGGERVDVLAEARDHGRLLALESASKNPSGIDLGPLVLTFRTSGTSGRTGRNTRGLGLV
jgi:hypothetical protein